MFWSFNRRYPAPAPTGNRTPVVQPTDGHSILTANPAHHLVLSVHCVGFEVLTAVSTKMAVFWVVAPYSLVEVYQRFRGPCCLHHQGDSSQDSNLQHEQRSYEIPIHSTRETNTRSLPWLTSSCISNRFHARGLLITLMMEAARTSETLVNFYQTIRCYNPEDSHLLICSLSIITLIWNIL
jgi:hypothetical protein